MELAIVWPSHSGHSAYDSLYGVPHGVLLWTVPGNTTLAGPSWLYPIRDASIPGFNCLQLVALYVCASVKGIVTQLSPWPTIAVCNSHDAFGGFYWPVMLRHIYLGRYVLDYLCSVHIANLMG